MTADTQKILGAVVAVLLFALALLFTQRRRASAAEPDTVAALNAADARGEELRHSVDRMLNMPPEIVRRDFNGDAYQAEPFKPLQLLALRSRRELIDLRVLDWAPPSSPARLRTVRAGDLLADEIDRR